VSYASSAFSARAFVSCRRPHSSWAPHRILGPVHWQRFVWRRRKRAGRRSSKQTYTFDRINCFDVRHAWCIRVVWLLQHSTFTIRSIARKLLLQVSSCLRSPLPADN
jgi:hypothetical protein